MNEPINGSPTTMVAFHGRVLNLTERMKLLRADALELIEDLATYGEGVVSTMPPSGDKDKLLAGIGTLQLSLAVMTGLQVPDNPQIEVAH